MSDYGETVDVFMESGDYYDVNVNELYNVHIHKTDEGIVVDLYDNRTGEYLEATTYYFDAEMESEE